MTTYTGTALVTKFAAYLIYKGATTAAALNLAQPKLGYVYDITEGGTLNNGTLQVLAGDAVMYLTQGWTLCNNKGATAAIVDLIAQFEELQDEIGETDFSKFALKTDIPRVPTKTSDLQNDSGFLTQHQSLENYALKSEIPDVSDFATFDNIPKKVSELENDENYLTDAVVADRVRKVEDLSDDPNKTDGEIILYTGASNANYSHGYFYKYSENNEVWTITRVNVQPEISVPLTDNFLSISNNVLGAKISIGYNSQNHHLELKGLNDTVVDFVDMTQFLKDGMLGNVEYFITAETGVSIAPPYLKFTFNTDSEKSVIRISLNDLVNIYSGANVNLTNAFAKAVTYTEPASGDSVDVAIGKLTKGVEEAMTAASSSSDEVAELARKLGQDNNLEVVILKGGKLFSHNGGYWNRTAATAVIVETGEVISIESSYDTTGSNGNKDICICKQPNSNYYLFLPDDSTKVESQYILMYNYNEYGFYNELVTKSPYLDFLNNYCSAANLQAVIIAGKRTVPQCSYQTNNVFAYIKDENKIVKVTIYKTNASISPLVKATSGSTTSYFIGGYPSSTYTAIATYICDTLENISNSVTKGEPQAVTGQAVYDFVNNYPTATADKKGFMSAADKTRISNLDIKVLTQNSQVNDVFLTYHTQPIFFAIAFGGCQIGSLSLPQYTCGIIINYNRSDAVMWASNNTKVLRAYYRNNGVWS